MSIYQLAQLDKLKQIYTDEMCCLGAFLWVKDAMAIWPILLHWMWRVYHNENLTGNQYIAK